MADEKKGMAAKLSLPPDIEATVTETPVKSSSNTISSQSQHHHYPHLPRRARHFLRPDGRKVHIAFSPDEAVRLRRRLSAIEKDEFDMVIHGSDQHVELLKETHAHHESLKDNLRSKYGLEVADEFENVIRELDHLSQELHVVSEHAVQLDANFEKFGYSAHLRTRDSPNDSAANSLYGDHPASTAGSDHHDWAAEKHQGTSMKFWTKPVVRQYFHKGLLWRASDLAEVGSYELFIDLLYVGIIDISGEFAVESANGHSLLVFTVTFILGWKFWTDLSVIAGWFDADDICRRLSVLFTLTCLLGFTVNITESYGETYVPLISFYLASRIFGATYYVLCAWWIPMVRGCMLGSCFAILLPVPLYIGSIHVEEPARQGLIWSAIALDLTSTVLLVAFQRGGRWMPRALFARTRAWFEFFPALNIEHKIERTNSFVTLIFGYSVLSLLFQSRDHIGINAFLGKAILGLIQAFSFNWLYFEVDSFNLHTHAIRQHISSSIVWNYVHLPFIMSYVVAAAALAKLVLAHDTPNSSPDTLAPKYRLRSDESIRHGQRWFYCAGLGVALICTGIISLTHVTKTIPGQRVRKRHRVYLRFVVGLAIVFLGFAESLNSLKLIGTSCSLVVFVLIVDLGGSTCVHEGFWCRTRHTTYAARTKLLKKELAASLKAGNVVKLEDVAKKHGGEKGSYDTN